MAKTYNLKITSATVIAGQVVGAGKIARDVDDRLARRLLGAGKAELVDGPLPEADESEGVTEGNTGADGGAVEPAAAKKTGAGAKAKKDDAE